jgi:hypothetical protein
MEEWNRLIRKELFKIKIIVRYNKEKKGEKEVIKFA